MNYEIVYVCESINNKNVRANELNILRKFEDKLYFEFGDSENNIKKRFYKEVETLNKDFKAIEDIKRRLAEEKEEGKDAESKIETKPEEVVEESFKKTKYKGGKRKIF